MRSALLLLLLSLPAATRAMVGSAIQPPRSILTAPHSAPILQRRVVDDAIQPLGGPVCTCYVAPAAATSWETRLVRVGAAAGAGFKLWNSMPPREARVRKNEGVA